MSHKNQINQDMRYRDLETEENDDQLSGEEEIDLDENKSDPESNAQQENCVLTSYSDEEVHSQNATQYENNAKDEEEGEEIDYGIIDASLIPNAETYEEHEVPSMDDFDIIAILGIGAYGKVVLARKLTGVDAESLYAIKILKKSTILSMQKRTEHTKWERVVMERVNGLPFLSNMQYAFQNPAKLYFVMEFVQGGELFTHLYRNEKFDFETTRFYIAELVIAIQELHDRNIVYRDLKLENVLIDSVGHTVLSDYGISKILTSHLDFTSSYCGTIEYMAPEVIRRESYGKAVDWWSIGVLAVELLSGQSPYSLPEELTKYLLRAEQNKRVSEKILREPPNIPDYITGVPRDFCEQLLVHDPNERLGYHEGAAEIKRHPFFNGIDWDALFRKGIDPPFKPNIQEEEDVSNFSIEFTSQPAEDDPFDSEEYPEIYFKGWNFVNEKFLNRPKRFVYLAEDEDGANGNILCILQKMQALKSSEFHKEYTFNLMEVIGEGEFSTVLKCQRRETGELFAVKVMRHRKEEETNVYNEVSALMACKGNEHIVDLVKVFHDDTFNYLVMELLEGKNLLEQIKSHTHFSEGTARNYFRQILEGLQIIHLKNFVHRDLKPDNIMFVDEKTENLKILDFGFAVPADTTKENELSLTPQYAPPEAFRGGPADFSRDIWSVGIILYVMLCGCPPFMSKSETIVQNQVEKLQNLLTNINSGNYNKSGLAYQKLSNEAKNMIDSLLNVNPAQRPTLKQLMKHPWFRENPGNQQLFDFTTEIPSMTAAIKMLHTVNDEIQTSKKIEREIIDLESKYVFLSQEIFKLEIEIKILDPSYVLKSSEFHQKYQAYQENGQFVCKSRESGQIFGLIIYSEFRKTSKIEFKNVVEVFFDNSFRYVVVKWFEKIWEVYYAENLNKNYFYNIKTGESAWHSNEAIDNIEATTDPVSNEETIEPRKLKNMSTQGIQMQKAEITPTKFKTFAQTEKEEANEPEAVEIPNENTVMCEKIPTNAILEESSEINIDDVEAYAISRKRVSTKNSVRPETSKAKKFNKDMPDLEEVEMAKAETTSTKLQTIAPTETEAGNRPEAVEISNSKEI